MSANNTSYTKPNIADYEVFTLAEDITLKTFYVLFALASLIGNSMVCFIILRYKRIQNTVNLLLLNLSFADNVTAVAVLPYVFVDISATKLTGKSADILCGITEGLAVFFVASLVNLLTLSILSLSRYILINHPTKQNWRIRKQSVKWFASASWIISFGFMTPPAVSFRYNPNDNICWRHWAKGIVPGVYFAATALMGMIIPLSTLTFTYISTIYTLWFKPSSRRLSRSNSRTTVSTSRKRISILLGMLIVAYLVCWVPFGVYWLLSAAVNYFPNTIEGQIKMIRITKYTILVALLNTCLDPIVYALSNRQIKDGARRTFRMTTQQNTIEPVSGTE